MGELPPEVQVSRNRNKTAPIPKLTLIAVLESTVAFSQEPGASNTETAQTGAGKSGLLRFLANE